MKNQAMAVEFHDGTDVVDSLKSMIFGVAELHAEFAPLFGEQGRLRPRGP